MNRPGIIARMILPTLSILLSGLSGSPTAAAEVTGIEIGLEGAQTAVQGEPLRWFFTLYEVVGSDHLRPARAGRLRISTSFRPDVPMAELVTDAEGRADAVLPVPEDAGSFGVTVEAVAGSFRRSFNLSVETTPPGRIDLVADRTAIQPGESVTFVGRAVSLPSGRPLPGRSVALSLTDQDGRSLRPEHPVETSRAGTFWVSLTALPKVTEINCNARIDGLEEASAAVSVRRAPVPRVVVRAVPRQRIVAPGTVVSVNVTVRRGDGRPVRGAVIHLTENAAPPDEAEMTTDATGRALIRWTAPGTIAHDVEDLTVDVWASRPGLDSASTRFAVRAARSPFQATVQVEGGGLLPGLPSRVYVYVTRPDGTPARDTRVTIDNPLLGTLSGRSDADGVAVFEGKPIAGQGIAGRDRCGGMTASSVKVTVFNEPEIPRSPAPASPVFERCVPVDPDGTVRVRPSKVRTMPGEPIPLALSVAPTAADLPIEIALLHVNGNFQTDGRNDDAPPSLVPLSRHIVKTKGQTRRTTLTIPEDTTGVLLIRARPLVGPLLQPARGGTALIFADLGPPLSATLRTASGENAHLAVSGAEGPVEAMVFPVPAVEADALKARLEERMLPPVLQLLGNSADKSADGSGARLAGLLAARTPRDDAAPTVLRGKHPVVVPTAADPALSGILRDPIRAGARFVRGRLALTIKTLEERLERARPEHLDHVGIVLTRGGSFNKEALNAVKGSNLIEGREPATLGGEPLTLRDLERMDPSFTFDNMARRVTRKRLLSVLVHLRRFVRERALDLRHSSQDPKQWLAVLAENAPEGDDNAAFDDGSEAPDARLLFDGWGRKLAILPIRNGSAPRFPFFEPLPPGYALVSAGPDGKFNTPDDLADPFARILPSGSIYAQAVGEDALLARLGGIEMSRATIEAVAGLFDEVYDENREAWDNAPDLETHQENAPPLNAPNTGHRFERSWQPMARSTPAPAVTKAGAPIPFTVDNEPRQWSLVGAAWSAEGRSVFERLDFSGGFPVILDAEPIRRLAPHEPLLVPVFGTILPGGPTDPIISVVGRGTVRAALEEGGTEAPLTVGPGGGFETLIRLTGEGEGPGRVHITVRSRTGRGKSAVTLPIEVRRPGLLRKLYADAALSAATALRLDIPGDAVEPKGAVVLVGPDMFLTDPTLAPWISRDPALMAWALTIAGQPLTGALLRQLEAATERSGTVKGEIPILSTACAAAAFAAIAEDDSRMNQTAVRDAVQRTTEGDDRRKLSTDAAVLAALSLAVTPGDVSPLAATIEAIRADLRNATRRYRNDPAFLARGAAALLLADRQDIRGKTMLALAQAHLSPGYRGGQVVDPYPSAEGETVATAERKGAEQLTATAALAIAAHQVGDDALALDSARGLAAGAAQAARLGGEPLFWFLAARAFGVFGMSGDGASQDMTVSIGDTAPRAVTLDKAPVIIPLPKLRPGNSIAIRATPNTPKGPLSLVYTSADYVRPAKQLSGGPLHATLTGDTGFAGERAALIATVANRGTAAVDHPVLFISLPAGAALDTAAEEAILRIDDVIALDAPDPRGIVKIRFKPLAPGGSIQLPIPLHWTAAGRRKGPALAVFPEDKDWELTVVPPRDIEVPFRPEALP